MQSEMWLNWALHITQLYNKCRNVNAIQKQWPPTVPAEQEAPVEEEESEPKLSGKCKEEMHANVCSNMYPALLMSLRNIDFGFVLQVGPSIRSLLLWFRNFPISLYSAWPKRE